MRMDYEFELRHLAAFSVIADELHFGRAAERLHIAQPALSRTIQQLERNLGYPLLVRTTRSVALTRAGESFAERARAILAECDDAVRATTEVASGIAGRLRVGFSGPTMLRSIGPLLHRFGRREHRWSIELVERATSAQIAALSEGGLDVGFFLSGLRIPEGIDTMEVSRARACIGVPHDHRFAGRDSLRLDELGDERVILFPRHRNPYLYDEIVDRVTEGHTRTVDIDEARSRHIAAGLVAAGLGVSTFTEDMRYVCEPDVVLIPQSDPERSVVTVMGWPADTRNPLLTRGETIA